MNGEGQSQQPEKPPVAPDPADAKHVEKAATTPGPRSGEQPQQVSTTPEAGDAEHPATAPKTSKTGDQAAGSRTAKVVAAVGTVLGTLVGFLIGVATSQVSDFVKRSDECLDALEQYYVGVSSNFVLASDSLHPPPGAPYSDNTGLLTKYNDTITGPDFKIKVTCFLDGNPLDLNDASIAAFNSNLDKMEACMHEKPCSDAEAYAIANKAAESTQDLAKQAQRVPNWSLLQRAEYAVKHLV